MTTTEDSFQVVVAVAALDHHLEEEIEAAAVVVAQPGVVPHLEVALHLGVALHIGVALHLEIAMTHMERKMPVSETLGQNAHTRLMPRVCRSKMGQRIHFRTRFTQ